MAKKKKKTQPTPAPSKGAIPSQAKLTDAQRKWLERGGKSAGWYLGLQSHERAIVDGWYSVKLSLSQMLPALPSEAASRAAKGKPGPKPGPKPAPKPPPGPAGAGADPGSIAGGAEAFLDDPQFFTYVPIPFMPDSDTVAKAKMNTSFHAATGRKMRPQEVDAALRAYRKAERRLYETETYIDRIAAAREFATATGGIGIPSVFARQMDQIAKSFMSGQLGPQEYVQQVHQAIAQAGSPAAAEVSGLLSSDFTPFSEDDFVLELEQAAAQASPVEHLGVNLRSAFEGFLQAIGGRVSQGSFAP